MADITLTGVVRSGDRLTLTGSGFTKTTTAVFVDDGSVAFEWISDTEITIDAPEAGTTISVEKGGVTSDELEAPAADAATAPATPTEETAAAAAAPQTPQNPVTKVKPEKRGEHVPGPNFREAVHQSPVTRIEEDLGIGVRDPYPTGNPPDARETFFLAHGYYPKEE